jgi:uncharacterized protein (UPF0332 family)
MPKTNKNGLAYQLKEQAYHLLNREPTRPRIVSLRRAVSTAYYALFHLVIDEGCRLIFKQDVQQNLIFYKATRAIRHDRLKLVSLALLKSPLSAELQTYFGASPISQDLKTLCQQIANLQDARHEADYDLLYRPEKLRVSKLFDDLEKAFQSFEMLFDSPNNELNLFMILIFDAKLKV